MFSHLDFEAGRLLRQKCWLLRTLVNHGKSTPQNVDRAVLFAFGNTVYETVSLGCEKLICGGTWEYTIDNSTWPHAFDDRRIGRSIWRLGSYAVSESQLVFTHTQRFQTTRPTTTDPSRAEFALILEPVSQPTPAEFFAWFESVDTKKAVSIAECPWRHPLQ